MSGANAASGGEADIRPWIAAGAEPVHDGPDGCTTVEVFGTLEGVFRVIAETPEGPREFDFRKGELPERYQPLP